MTDTGTSSRWVAPAALLIALIAVGIAIWAVVRSPGESGSADTVQEYDAQQSTDAKARVCGAFDTVRKAVSVQTNIELGPDPVAKEAVAANARLATLGGGDYLLARLEPATPPDLADAVRSFANTLQDIGMNQLVGTPNSDATMTTWLSDAQSTSMRIADMCK